MSEAPVSPVDATARIAALEASLARANAALAARDLLIDTLRGQIARLRRMQFGASSEKLGREIEQLELALEELETERDVPVSKVANSGMVARPVPVRNLPGHLPREEVVHEPVSGACTCPDCGGALRPLGSDAHEMLDIVPVRWRVGECQEFRVWAGIMGKKETRYVSTQRACDTERAAGSIAGWR